MDLWFYCVPNGTDSGGKFISKITAVTGDLLGFLFWDFVLFSTLCAHMKFLSLTVEKYRNCTPAAEVNNATQKPADPLINLDSECFILALSNNSLNLLSVSLWDSKFGCCLWFFFSFLSIQINLRKLYWHQHYSKIMAKATIYIVIIHPSIIYTVYPSGS